MARTRVSLLCGFLGSGKTTLLSALLEQAQLSNAVVIVNEFGEVSIDHLIIADVAENILELRNGCLCCTIRGDLVMTLRDLHLKRQLGEIKAFDHVIIETTGIADPLPLAHTLMANPPIMQAYQLDSVVCVVDAVVGATTLAAHETAANQLALADLVVVSKRDIASAEELTQTRAVVSEINHAAQVVEVSNGEIDNERIFGRGLFDPAGRLEQIESWLAAERDHDHHHHDSIYTTHSIVFDGTLSLAGTSVFLNHIVNEQRERILRIKGLAGFREREGAPAIIHAVQDKFYPINWLSEWPSDDHSARLVFIGRNLDVTAIEAKFKALCI